MIPSKSMPLIHEGNRAFLKDNHQKLEQSEEALENLAASMGIIRVRDPLGCASTLGLGIGVVWVTGGMFLSVIATASLLRSFPLMSIGLTVLLLTVGLLLLLLIGPYSIIQPYLMGRSQGYLAQLYHQLLARGEIMEGTIISAKPVMIGQTITKQILIHYRFTAITLSGNCEGQYKISSQVAPHKTFAPGQKVTILYLNRCVQILL